MSVRTPRGAVWCTWTKHSKSPTSSKIVTKDVRNTTPLLELRCQQQCAHRKKEKASGAWSPGESARVFGSDRCIEITSSTFFFDSAKNS